MKNEQLILLSDFYEMKLEDVLLIAVNIIPFAENIDFHFYGRTVDESILFFQEKNNQVVGSLDEIDLENLSGLINQMQIIVESYRNPGDAKISNEKVQSVTGWSECRSRCFNDYIMDNNHFGYHKCLIRCDDLYQRPIPSVNNAACILYSGTNYSGNGFFVEYNADNRDLRRNRFNDRASSIRVNNNWKIKVSEHIQHGGKSMWIHNDIPDLSKTKIGSNTISSLIAVRK